MKKLFWKIRYVRALKKRGLISFPDAFGCAEAALEMVDYDLTECPADMAFEELQCWSQDL